MKKLFRFIHTWGLVPSQLASAPADAWLTIFTGMFLHGGWFHILSNMWVLFIFGDNVEAAWAADVTCSFLQRLLRLMQHIYPNTPMIGASGAIAGVLAFLILSPLRIASLVPIFNY